jgi:hypothetical protein
MPPLRLSPVVALIALAAAAAPAPAAAAVPRDGAWAGSERFPACEPDRCQETQNVARVVLRDRVVRSVRYSIIMLCRDPETGDQFDRSFTGGQAFPAGRRIGRSLVTTASYREQDNLRDARVRTRVDFRGSRPKLFVQISTVGGSAECTANVTIRLKHGR